MSTFVKFNNSFQKAPADPVEFSTLTTTTTAAAGGEEARPCGTRTPIVRCGTPDPTHSKNRVWERMKQLFEKFFPQCGLPTNSGLVGMPKRVVGTDPIICHGPPNPGAGSPHGKTRPGLIVCYGPPVPIPPDVTTMALGEEGGGFVTSMALGEEGGGGKDWSQPPVDITIPIPKDTYVTLAMGEEGGGNTWG
jgi:hypothetical protein